VLLWFCALLVELNLSTRRRVPQARDIHTHMRAPRPPPGAVNTAPVAAACAAALAYFAYSVHYSRANVGSSANATKTAPWWRPSN